MPTEFYSKWLIKTKERLEAVLDYDAELAKGRAVKDRSLANHLLGGLYARYSMVVQDLDACLDQLVQVQKSFAVRKITEAAAARLDELKEELTKLDVSEYHYIDGALIELKLVPQSVEMIFPTLVYPRDARCERMWTRLKNDETIYEPSELADEGGAEGGEGDDKRRKKKVKIDPLALLVAVGASPATAEEEVAEEEEEEMPEEEDEGFELGEGHSSSRRLHQSSTGFKREKKKRPCNRPKVASQLEAEMSAEEKAALEQRQAYNTAVVMIQAHERARQARLYVHDVLAARVSNATPTSGTTASTPAAEEDGGGDARAAAALLIQAWWRGVMARMRAASSEMRRRLLIGMARPSYRSTEEVVACRKGLERGRLKRYEAIGEYYQTLLDEKARVLKVVAPGLFEDIGDEIRQWFKDWYYSCKTFKDIPPAAQGGTVLVVRWEVESPQEHFQEMLKSDARKAAAAATKQKEDAKKASAEKKKLEEAKKKKAAAKAKAKTSGKRGGGEFQPARTEAMDAIEGGVREYDERWADVDDAANPLCKPYMDVITEQMCYEVQMEVRPKVDELMRLELAMLKGAVQMDKQAEKQGTKGKKGKKGKKGGGKAKKGKKKGKKAKGAGGKRGRTKADPTGKRKVEDLFQELYKNGIIRKYPEVPIGDYICDFSYQNFEQREQLLDPPATLEDARQAVTMSCILPIGAGTTPRAKSVLLVGPRECGLEQLAGGVFSATRCVLFDLSPNNVYGKYAGAKGNKELAHLVPKMAKLLEPSIIYVGDAEKVYYKKVPKEERESDPRRVGKFLAKIVKAVGVKDRVLVLGTSYYPQLARAARLRKVFQKVVLVPRSDYGSVYIFWETVLLGYHGVDRGFNISALATMTRHYPLPQIRAAIERVLVPARRIQLHYRPLEARELLDALREGAGPVDDAEWEKYVKFYAGTKLGKARKRLNAELAKAVAKQRKKAAAGGGKGAA